MSSRFNIPNNIIFQSYFLFWKDANHVEEFYMQRLESYLYNYSHEQSKIEDSSGGIKLYYSGVTKDGIEITENDFIHQEIYKLNRIPLESVDFDGRKRVEFYRQYLQKRLMNILMGETKPLPKPEIDLDAKITRTTWFKIGLTFATGQAQELYEKYKQEKGHFRKIAIKLGFKETDRPYFSETINNSTISNKNLYSSPDKLKTIYAYCQVKNIEVCPDFIAQIESV